MFIYSIKDELAQEFGPLFEAKNNDVAERYYNDLVAKTTQPEDYNLYILGEFDRDTGELKIKKSVIIAGGKTNE